MAVSPSGVTLAVWLEESQLWSASATARGDWSERTLIADVPNGATELQLAMNEAGEASVLWSESWPTLNVTVVHFSPAAGWGGRTDVVTGLPGDMYFYDTHVTMSDTSSGSSSVYNVDAEWNEPAPGSTSPA